MDEQIYSSGTESHNVSTSKAFVIVSSTTAVLSMLGTLLIFITYFAWKEIRTSSRQILLFISIADFCTALGNMFSVIHDRESDDLCKIQSFVTTASSLCSFFWTTFMAAYLLVTVVLKKPALAERLLCAFHLFGWGVPLAITGAALGFDVLGDDKDLFSAGWCWIKKMKSERQIMWMWFTGKGWEIATYLLIAVFYAVLKWHIRQDIRYKHEQFTTITARHAASKADRKLTFVPLVFILCRIWGTVRFLLYVSNVSKNDMTWLVYLQGIGDNAQGFANFMLFCFCTEKFQKKFQQVCCPCIKSRHVVIGSSQGDPHNVEYKPPRASINERTSLLSSTSKSNGSIGKE